MIEQLYLCGTTHVDFEGPKRLGKVLDVVRPDVIAVEMTPKGYSIFNGLVTKDVTYDELVALATRMCPRK